MAGLKYLAVGAVIFLFVSPIAHAGSIIWGVGDAPCTMWSDTRTRNHALSVTFTEWVAGFATARGTPAPNKTRNSNDRDIYIDGWLKTYCARHPRASLLDAAEEFSKQR